ncbi:hypothetical protein SAMN03159341_103284 [Paenibacillus sp. 1_12]|uniref:hypothetical protein n=1 Tax=Paenibacillus sp. 1_12 TaxID=1566278 RepID=UPI0008E0F5F3|nr:hypothetical protein [Paenibacillus sp. 1_12]SFL11290.1 hypothetical protein SAMN03159341_103284 [Paenibacillus sp. 1_12]
MIVEVAVVFVVASAAGVVTFIVGDTVGTLDGAVTVAFGALVGVVVDDASFVFGSPVGAVARTLLFSVGAAFVDNVGVPVELVSEALDFVLAGEVFAAVGAVGEEGADGGAPNSGLVASLVGTVTGVGCFAFTSLFMILSFDKIMEPDSTTTPHTLAHKIQCFFISVNPLLSVSIIQC